MKVDSMHQNFFKDIYRTTAALGTPFIGKLFRRQCKLLQMLSAG